MSLFVGVKSKDYIYIATDGRTWCEVPQIGIRIYDTQEKLGSLGNASTVWATSSGMSEPAHEIFYRCTEKGIESIDTIKNFDPTFFKTIHHEFLSKYAITYNGKNDLVHGLTLLFGGIDKQSNLKLYLVDSAKDYELDSFSNPGDFIFNTIDAGEIDCFLTKELNELTDSIDQYTHKEILTKLKKIFKHVSLQNWGVSPLMYFVRIGKEEVDYIELHKVKKFLDKIKLSIDKFMFFEVLGLHKLSPHCHIDYK